jgi:undecaprenyl-diphosphatase
MNESLFRFINGFAGQSIALDAVIVFFTDSAGIILLFTFLLYAMHLFYHRRRADAKLILLSFVTAGFVWMIGYVMKIVFAAPRPVILLPDVRELIAYGARDAFPSGHATFYFALAGALFVYDKKLGAAAMVVATLIGCARIAAGIHWPLDIAAGAVLGVGVAGLLQLLVRNIQIQRQSH